MCDFKEIRKIKYSSSEVYCRYLNIDLPLLPRSSAYNGRFGAELKNIGMEKFPYGIHPSELVSRGILKPALYVELPKEYFKNWKNFPECPRNGGEDIASTAGMYKLELLPQTYKELRDFIHPYDGELQQTFVQKYRAEVPAHFLEHQHSNCSKYIAAEVYLPYWHTYALADSFYSYRHAAILLSAQDGKERVLKIIGHSAKRFCDKYATTFDRISWYKTIVTGLQFNESSYTHGDIFSLAQGYSEVTADVLKQDLNLLLELDAEWANQIKQHGCLVLHNARKNLSKDIYLIYEQLRLLGVTAKTIFEVFQPSDRNTGMTPLHEVLDAEYYIFRQSFVTYGNFYCAGIKKWGYECSDTVFDALVQISGFDAWMRSFHDLHHTLNDQNSQAATFKQGRIVDALIVMSVRTEIVLREMFRPILQDQSDEAIFVFLKKVVDRLPDKEKVVLKTCCNEIAQRTKLNEKPQDIFVEIDSLNPNNWSKEKVHFLHVILKFITARNYFAHHAYKDDDLNYGTSMLASEVLQSLLATLLFFQKASAIAFPISDDRNVLPEDSLDLDGVKLVTGGASDD